LRRFNVEQLYDQYQISKKEMKVKDSTNTDGKMKEEDEAGSEIDERPAQAIDSAPVEEKAQDILKGQALSDE